MKMRNVLFFQYPWRLWRDRLAGVYRYAKKAKWQVSVAEYGRNFESIAAALKFWSPDGLIVEGGYTELPGFRLSDFNGFPVVFCDARASRMRGKWSGVVHDSSATAALAAKELLSLGFSNYAFVGNLQPREWSEQRRKVFSKAVEAAGKRIDVFRTGNVEAFDEFRERLTPWLSGLPRPCGLLAANDTTADVVLRVLRGLRIKVPEDIAVVGIDNDPLICENTTPTLTSVAPDFESSGYIAAEMLDAKMAGRCAGDEIRTFGALHVVRRGSTRILKRRDDAIKKALEFIREGVAEGMSPRDVVRQIGGSRRQAEYRFREFVGTSIGEEINNVRLEMAKKLLADSSVPIGSVAARCGYGDDSSLRRAFKSATGLSLSAFRRSLA
jgi:LacI family transcriptional regulator